MSDKVYNKIKEIVEQGLKTFNAEGTAIAVVKDGKTILLDGFGLADKEKNIKMTADHVLPIASTSKAFTATSVAMLADEEKLELDTPVREYMPEFALKDTVASNAVTARDMLCHRTGLPRHDLLWINWADIERDELVFKRARHLLPNKSFRSTWQYQNHMYAAAGCLVERISGKSWEEFVRERIFEPLGMKSSSFGQEKKDSKLDYSVLYKPDKDGANEECEPETVACIGPAGSIRSTARDMAEWLKFNLAGGKAGDKELLSEKIFPELHKPNIPYELFPFEIDETQRLGYGLGWFLDCFRGEKMVQHGGNVSGASILVSMIPSKNIGCAILTNTDSSLMDYAISLSIFDALMEQEDEKDWLGFFIEKQNELKKQSEEGFNEFYESKLPDKPMLHELEDYCGEYSNPAYGELRVFENEEEKDADKKLRIDFHGNIIPVTHMHYDIFYVTVFEYPLPASFITGVDGSIESLHVQFEPSMEDFIEFKRIKN